MPRFDVDVTHTQTWTAVVTIENAIDEDDASKQALERAENESKLLEHQQTINWELEEDYFEVDDATELEGEEDDDDEDPEPEPDDEDDELEDDDEDRRP